MKERADELNASGMTKKAALRAARRQFGNYSQLQERTRDMNIHIYLETLGTDVRYAIRGLRRSFAFALTAVTIALAPSNRRDHSRFSTAIGRSEVDSPQI